MNGECDSEDAKVEIGILLPDRHDPEPGSHDGVFVRF